MKRIIAVLLCMLFVFAMPLVAFAEETEVVDTEVVETEPVEEETDVELITDAIAEFLKENSVDLGLVLSIIAAIIAWLRENKNLKKTIGTLNNNAVAVAEKSSSTIGDAMTNISIFSGLFESMKNEFAKLLEEARANEQEKKELKDLLVKTKKYLEVSKEANIAMAAEVAKLITLANLPTSVKDELYASHLALVAKINALEEAEVTDDEVEEA